MSDKHFVGLDLVSLEDKKKMRPISRVTFMLDDQNSVTAGDDTGMEIVADNAHATQEMANAVLARLRGYQYHAFEAGSASLDPSAELGDGITAGGVYSFIGRLNDGGDGYPGIDAPGEAELEDEYPSAGPMTQEFNQKISETRSSITKTAEQIRLEVSNDMQNLSASIEVQLGGIVQRVQGLDGKYSEVKITLDGLTVTGQDGSTRIKGSQIETGSIAAGSITADKLNLTGSISWGDLDWYSQSQITGAQQTAGYAYDLAYANQLPSYIKSTYIDSTTVMAPSISGGSVTGGTIVGSEIYFGGNGAAGNLNYTNGFDGQNTTDLIQLGSTSGIEIVASTNIRISPGRRIYLDVDVDDLRVRSGGSWISIRSALGLQGG